MIHVRIPLVITPDFNQGRTQQKTWVYTCTPDKKKIEVSRRIIRSDPNTNSQIAQVRSDPNTNSQIAQVRVRVLNFAQQEGKRRGGHTCHGGFRSPAKAPTKTWAAGA
jgi:hypothetical protein